MPVCVLSLIHCTLSVGVKDSIISMALSRSSMLSASSLLLKSTNSTISLSRDCVAVLYHDLPTAEQCLVKASTAEVMCSTHCSLESWPPEKAGYLTTPPDGSPNWKWTPGKFSSLNISAMSVAVSVSPAPQAVQQATEGELEQLQQEVRMWVWSLWPHMELEHAIVGEERNAPLLLVATSELISSNSCTTLLIGSVAVDRDNYTHRITEHTRSMMSQSIANVSSNAVMYTHTRQMSLVTTQANWFPE